MRNPTVRGHLSSRASITVIKSIDIQLSQNLPDVLALYMCGVNRIVSLQRRLQIIIGVVGRCRLNALPVTERLELREVLPFRESITVAFSRWMSHILVTNEQRFNVDTHECAPVAKVDDVKPISVIGERTTCIPSTTPGDGVF